MARVIRSDRADRDLVRILVTTGIERGRRAADRLLTRIERKSTLYARLSLNGIRCEDYGADVRCFLVQPYLVFYRPVEGGIEVARILHGARDIRSDMFEP